MYVIPTITLELETVTFILQMKQVLKKLTNSRAYRNCEARHVRPVTLPILRDGCSFPSYSMVQQMCPRDGECEGLGLRPQSEWNTGKHRKVHIRETSIWRNDELEVLTLPFHGISNSSYVRNPAVPSFPCQLLSFPVIVKSHFES